MRKSKYDFFRYTLDIILFVFLTILYMQLKKVEDIQKSIRFNFRSDVTATVQISQLQKENQILKCKVIELEDKCEKALKIIDIILKRISFYEIHVNKDISSAEMTYERIIKNEIK